jgi:hypothetical protein
LAKDITSQSEGAPAKTYPASRKASPNQDKSTYTSGEQEQLMVYQVLTCVQHYKHHKLSIMV